MSTDMNGNTEGVDRWSEALSWRATLSADREEDLTYAVGRAWQAWHADPDNRRAFDAVNRLLADRGRYRRRGRVRSADLEADEYDLSVPIAQWRAAQALNENHTKPARARHGRQWLLGGLAAAAVAVATVAALIPLWPLRLSPGTGPSIPALYQTRVGAIKNVHLPDGSTIVLGSRTQLLVAYSAQRRSVTLMQGQAWFKAVHDPRWPFVVNAGQGTITAAGTAFVVTRYSDRVVVAVTQGTVVVKARPAKLGFRDLHHKGILKPVLIPVRLTEGNELTFSENGTVTPIHPTAPSVATAWTHGQLIFNNQRLLHVVEEVNRYSSQPIVVGSSAGDLRFGGVVHVDEIPDWLQSLKAIFPVTVEERAGTTYIRMRRPR